MPCPVDHPRTAITTGRAIDPRAGLRTSKEIFMQTSSRNLGGVLLEVGDEVVPLLGLLETTEGHLSTGNELLGVLEVGEQSVLVPGNTSLLVGVGVGVSLGLTGLTAKETVQVGADLVGTASLDGVALSATGLEELGTLASVTCREELLAVCSISSSVSRSRRL